MTTKRPGKGWWFFAAVILLFFIVLQLPAAWVLARLAPQNPYITHVTGNIWSGQADWQYQQLQGVVDWKIRPWELLLLRVGADVEMMVGESQLQGRVAVSKTMWSFDQMNGRIAANTLRTLLPWQWPDSPVQIQDLSLRFDQQQGWSDAEGQMNWGGGVLGYPFEGRVERASLPPLVGTLRINQERLHVGLTDQAKARMGDFYLSKDRMLDVQLTQRLLQNVAGYRGQAGLDTAVITTRQPLASVGAF
jgi:general secretion pathway protein N